MHSVAWWLGMLVASACHAAVPATDVATAPVEWVDDLRPITAADWTRERAAHLVERAGFGALPAEVQHSLTLGPRAAVAALVRPLGANDPAALAFERSGLPDAGIDPFPETRPLATDLAKARVRQSASRQSPPVTGRCSRWSTSSSSGCAPACSNATASITGGRIACW